MLIFPLRKADATSRRVIASLDESVDRAGEAMDYAASKPVVQAWSDEQFAASQGLSKGNVRGMHAGFPLGTAAGVVREIAFDDDTRAISFDIEVVDDGEWEKVLKGVYTGISPGGKAARRMDGTIRRFSVTSMHELSLVDTPCNPNATFTLIKADGGEQAVSFIEPAQPGVSPDTLDLLKAFGAAQSPAELGALVIGLAADDLAKALGDTSAMNAPAEAAHLWNPATRRDLAAQGVAMADGRFPIAALADIEAASLVLLKAADADAQAHVIARAEALGLAASLPEAWRPPTMMIKGLYSVSRMASLIDSLTSLAADVTCEAGWEGDGSAIPARLSAWIAEGAAIFQAMAGEETMEAVASLSAAVAQLPAMPKPVVEIVSDDDDPMMKGARLPGDVMGMVINTVTELATARESLAKANAATDSMRAELERLRAMPQPGGVRLRAVGRGEDIAPSSAGDPELAAFHAMPDGLAKAAVATRLAMTGRLSA